MELPNYVNCMLNVHKSRAVSLLTLLYCCFNNTTFLSEGQTVQCVIYLHSNASVSAFEGAFI